MIVGIIVAVVTVGFIFPVLRANPRLIADVEKSGGVNVSKKFIFISLRKFKRYVA